MGCCHAYGFRHRYRCGDCGEPLLPYGYAAQPIDYAPPPLRDEYVQRIEAERDALEQRLRKLERELEELRTAARH